MKSFKYIFLLVLGMTAFSCQDQLELQPQQSLSTTESLADIDGLRTALFGAYDGIQSVNYYGRNYQVIAEVIADQVYLSINNSNRFVFEYTYQYGPNQGTQNGFWGTAYTTILRANNIINRIDDVEGAAAEKNQIKGEALAIRAMAHFDLVRVYGKQPTQGNPSTDLGVPIVLVSKIDEPARNTVAAVYDQIVKDLNDAKGLLGDAGIYRFSAQAADALLARVLLYRGDNAGAEAAAGRVIASGKYSLASNIVAAFEGPGSSEEIFTLKFIGAETRGSDNWGQIYNPQGYGDIRVTSDLMNLYEAGDARLGFIYKNTNNEFYQSKTFAQEGVPGLASPKLLRIAEMYLIRAEARAKQNKFADAIADLNAIRAKRGASNLSGIADANVLSTVLAERQREMAFEGHASFDYFRNGIKMVRTQCSTGLELASPCELEANSYLTAFPIPQAEMDVNQNMVQNPGYN